MSHLCHAIGCNKAVPAKLLFCFPHWKMTSRETQRLIWALYRRGQENTKDPSPGYLIAQALAVAEVAVKERKWDADRLADHVLSRARRVVELLTPEEIKVLARHSALRGFSQFLEPKKEVEP